MHDQIVPRHGSRLLYVDHVEERGEDLFNLVCDSDLEGMVAKWKLGRYMADDRTSWVKSGIGITPKSSDATRCSRSEWDKEPRPRREPVHPSPARTLVHSQPENVQMNSCKPRERLHSVQRVASYPAVQVAFQVVVNW